MKEEAIIVVGPDKSRLTVQPGALWPLPFRGSRYTVCRMDGRDRIAWTRYDQRVAAVNNAKDLVDAVRRTKAANGSFRVTAHRAVITKAPLNGGESWEPRYVGIYEGDLEFEGIDNAPTSLEMGMYWTGFPFRNGEAWSVSPYAQSRNHLHWRMNGRRFASTDRYPEVLRACLGIRPRGGRLYVTESGHLWMNVTDGGLAPWYREEFRSLQCRQVDELLDQKKTALVRLLVDRIESTNTRPVYIGHISAFDHGEPPWTFFSPENDDRFGSGGQDVADDELRAR